jgi:cell shape-determining protein MreC
VINVETTQGGVRGVAKGERGLNVILDMVEQGKNLEEGEGVVTSGLSGQVARGFLLGTLHDIRLSEDKLFQRATIQSPVDITRTRFVFVVR